MPRPVLAFAVVLVAAACGANPKVVEVLESTPGSSPTIAESAVPPAVGPGAGRAIVVRTPARDAEIVSPVTVSGTADVSEGALGIVILDAAGQELAAMPTQASCGTGCRGKFSATLAFFTEERQAGIVQVFEASAEGGPPPSLVEIPVTLVPG